MCEQNCQKWIEAAEKSAYRPDRLAKRLHICRKQLERWTKLRFGKTPQAWLDEQRLCKALKLLKRNQPIKNVAQRLGFKQLSHFSRKFKMHHGLAPRQFVEALRTNHIQPHSPSSIVPLQAHQYIGHQLLKENQPLSSRKFNYL
jgi:AraC-like DNA-binding protein